MGIVEKFWQKEKEEKQAAGSNTEIKGPTVKEILADTEKSRLFGLYLKENGAHELGEKMAAGDLGKDDFRELEGKRKDFLELSEGVKKMQESLDMPRVKALIEASPDLRQIADVVGVEGIRDALLGQLHDMAIADPARFRDMQGATEALAETRAAFLETNKELAEICRKIGASEEEYVQAIKSNDPHELNDLIRGKMGLVRKLFTSKNGIAEMAKDADKSNIIRDRLDELQRNQDALAGAMRAALFDNEGVKRALIAGFRGETMPKGERGMSFSELKNIQKDAVLNGGEIDAAWDEYWADHQNDAGITEDIARTNFAGDYARDTLMKGKRGGFWATILSEFFASAIGDMLKQ